MKINFVVNAFPTTSETFLFNLVCGLEQRGVKVQVCSHSKRNDKDLYQDKYKFWSGNIAYLKPSLSLIGKLAAKNNRKILIEYINKKGFLKGLKLFSKWLLINRDNPDLIYFSFSGIAASYRDVLENENIKTPFVFSCRGSAEKIRPLIDSDRAEKLIYLAGRAKKIHCVSRDMMETLLEYCKFDIEDKVFINYPSINTDVFSTKIDRTTNKPFKILSTGRLHFQKGYVYSLKAIKILKSQGYDVEYHICGAGPEEGLLRFMIKMLGLQDTVVMHGRVSNSKVKSLISQSDAFLLGSIYEGIANAAIEAMASGLPVVSSDSGGMRELIVNKKNGILVPLFSDQELAEGLKFLIDNPIHAREMAKNGVCTVREKFTLENQLDIFMNNFEAIVKDG